jgi:hypothetical protein
MKAVLCFLALGALLVPGSRGEVANGQPAPGFTLISSEGKEVALSQFRGKTVVLEWVNFGCPFVKKFYGSGEMQRLQKEAAGKGVVWLSICSSAPGRQGYIPPENLAAEVKAQGVASTAYLADSDGKTGRAYGAKTTPHLFVINPEGNVVYQGAIDSIESAKPEDIGRAANYVRLALEETLAGKPVTVAQTKSYGCSVKY